MRNLYVTHKDNSCSGTNCGPYSVHDQAPSSGLTCTLTNGGSSSCSDTTHTYSAAPGYAQYINPGPNNYYGQWISSAWEVLDLTPTPTVTPTSTNTPTKTPTHLLAHRLQTMPAEHPSESPV
jgi:hypothetical protein